MSAASSSPSEETLPTTTPPAPTEPVLNNNNNTAQDQKHEEKKEEEEKKNQVDPAIARLLEMLQFINSPIYNSSIGQVPSAAALIQNWHQIGSRIPLYQLHGSVCPKNPNSSKRFFVGFGASLHSAVSSCTCKMELTPSKEKMFEEITTNSTGRFSSDPCMIFIEKPDSFTTHTLAMCVVQRAILTEQTVNVRAMNANSKPPVLIADIEVYVQTEQKVDEFVEICTHQLIRNGRYILSPSPSKYQLMFRHPVTRTCSLIRVMPHKAIRKSWHVMPAGHIYIDDIYALTRDTAALRHFIHEYAFSPVRDTTSEQTMRRFVIVGTHPATTDISDVATEEEMKLRTEQHKIAVSAVQNLVEIRSSAMDMQMSRLRLLEKAKQRAQLEQSQNVASLFSKKSNNKSKETATTTTNNIDSKHNDNDNDDDDDEKAEADAYASWYDNHPELVSLEELELQRKIAKGAAEIEALTEEVGTMRNISY